MAAVRKAESVGLFKKAKYNFEHSGGKVRVDMKAFGSRGEASALTKELDAESREGVHARAMHDALQALEKEHWWGGVNQSAGYFVHGFGEVGFELSERAAGGVTLEKLVAHYKERFGTDYQNKKKRWPDTY